MILTDERGIIQENATDYGFFASEKYWEDRYKLATANCGSEKSSDNEASYEWFDSGFSVLQPLIERYTQSSDFVLEIGCGTSDLLPGLRKAGHRGLLVGTDFSESAVEYMQSKHGQLESTAYKALRFEKMDARDMKTFSNNSVNIVLDKGCLNGVVSSQKHGEKSAFCICQEICRVLQPGGWFLSFSCHDPYDSDEGSNGMNVLEELLLPGLVKGQEKDSIYAWKIDVHSSEDPSFKIHLYAFQKRVRPRTRSALRGDVPPLEVSMFVH